jgi:hypothetical protein
MTTYPKISITLRDTTLAQIDRRTDSTDHYAGRSSVIGKSLDRYHAILDAHLRVLREKLNDEETGLILDVLNGTLFADTISIGFVWHEIANSLSDGYAAKWNCDGSALVAKLKSLSYADNAALVDAVERWWNRVGAGENTLPPSEALK